MPIKALARTASFPEIGQLRKGAPKPENGKAPGKDLDCFRFTSSDPSAVAAFEEAFGKQPQAINVFLPFPSMAENFEFWQEEYTANALKHRCDGETCTLWLTDKGTYSTDSKPCPGGCKPSGRLKVFIPAFQRLAFVTALTTSKHDIISIASSLQALESVRGNLQGIPLILRRIERDISTPAANGARARRKKWLLQIEAEPQWAALQFGAMREAALLTQGREPLMLEAGEVSDEEDDETHPLDYTEAGVPTGVSTGNGKAEYASAETISAIRNLWPKYGTRKQGQLVPFEIIVRQNGWTLDTWPAERAAKVLADLQSRALNAEQTEAERKQAIAKALGAKPAPAEQPAESEVIEGEVVEPMTEEELRDAAHQLTVAMAEAKEAGVSASRIVELFALHFPQKADIDELEDFEKSEFAKYLREFMGQK